MKLYLGEELVSLIFSNEKFNLHIAEKYNPIRLFSSDRYVLQDLNGVYLIPKEDE
jgi:hypothetical protein